MTKTEEYRTIREEMLQRFKRSNELLLFSITVTAVLLSWMATQKASISLSCLVFSAVGLGVSLYVFYLYESILRQIYHQGSYIAVFYEIDKTDLKYHLLTRFFDYLKETAESKKTKSKCFICVFYAGKLC